MPVHLMGELCKRTRCVNMTVDALWLLPSWEPYWSIADCISVVKSALTPPKVNWNMNLLSLDKKQDHFGLLFWCLLAPFAISACLAIIVLGLSGAGATGTRFALTVTARFSFLLFWLAYTGGALAALFGPAFLRLKRHAREFGLAFASAQLVHLGLVVWLCHLGQAPGISTFVFFGIAAFWLYLIAFFSIGNLWFKLPNAARRIIFFVGLNYIAYAFAVDFLRNPLQGGFTHIAYYLPFAALSVAGPVLRVLACLCFFREEGRRSTLERELPTRT